MLARSTLLWPLCIVFHASPLQYSPYSFTPHSTPPSHSDASLKTHFLLGDLSIFNLLGSANWKKLFSTVMCMICQCISQISVVLCWFRLRGPNPDWWCQLPGVFQSNWNQQVSRALKYFAMSGLQSPARQGDPTWNHSIFVSWTVVVAHLK